MNRDQHNEKANIRISVIIPTRERADVLKESLRTVVAQDYADLEILVSDNFSNDETQEIVRGVADSRVRYLNTGRRLSMSRNWEFALSHVTGDWVTIIGDDDGLLPDSVLKVAHIIRSSDVKAIRSRVCSYQWPSLTGKSFGRLGVPLQRGQEMRDTRLWLARVLNGHATYLELPMLYNGGYVSVSVLNDIKAKTGSFYRSRIPDVYSAISISSTIDRYLYLHEPLAINGASKHSTGTSQFGNDQNIKNSPSQKFASEENIPFHEDIPLCPDGSLPASLQAFVYESYLQSRDLREPTREGLHAQQLTVILATSKPHDALIGAWSQAFALKHQLNLDNIRATADRKKWRFRLSSYWRTAMETFSTWGVGSVEAPIKTVFDASVTAHSILTTKLRRLKNLKRLGVRLMEKLVGRD